MPPGGLGKIALCAMPVGLEDSPNGHGFAALWVEFPSDPLRAVVPCSMPKRFAFSAQNTVPPFRASQLCPFFMSWNGKRPSLVFSSRGTGKLPSGNNPLRLRLFFMRNRETFTKRESAAAPQPFPDPFTKVLGGRGVGFGEGRGKPFFRKASPSLPRTPSLPLPRLSAGGEAARQESLSDGQRDGAEKGNSLSPTRKIPPLWDIHATA